MATAAWKQLDDEAELALPQAFYTSWWLRTIPLVGLVACALWFTSVRQRLGPNPPTTLWIVMGAFLAHNAWMTCAAWFRPVVRVRPDHVISYTGLFGRRGELSRRQVLELREAAEATRYWDWFRLPWFARRILGQLSRDGRKRLAIALHHHDVLGVFD